MNRLMFLISAIALSSTQLFAKTVVNVAENTFKIEGTGGEKEFYYGFAQGDQLIFNFSIYLFRRFTNNRSDHRNNGRKRNVVRS